jgi:hypothetical protein
MRTGTTVGKWRSWDDALAEIQNPAVVDYFRAELAAKRDSYLRKRVLRYRVNGRRVLNVEARNQNAYCWQLRRFAGDEALWKSVLGESADVEEVKAGRCVRFWLETKDQFAAFLKTVQNQLPTVTWLNVSDEEIDPDLP